MHSPKILLYIRVSEPIPGPKTKFGICTHAHHPSSSFLSTLLSTLQQYYLLLHPLLFLPTLLSPCLGLSFIYVLSLSLSEAGEKALLLVRGRGYRIVSPQKATTCLHTGGKYPSVAPSSTGQ